MQLWLGLQPYSLSANARPYYANIMMEQVVFYIRLGKVLVLVKQGFRLV